MSSTFNQKQSFWKMVEATLRSNLVRKGADGKTALTAEDAASWSKTLVLNCLILQDLLPDGSRLRSDGALKQWCNTIAKTDIKTVAKAMKEYQLFIRTYPDEWQFLSYDDFKHRLPYRFTGDYWSPVKDILVSYLSDPGPADFQVLNQWVSFPLKLTLKGLADDLTQKAEEEYLENEARLAGLVFPDDLCTELAAVIEQWFRGLTYALDFTPRHSNGAVSNRRKIDGRFGKYTDMHADFKIEYLYRKFNLSPRDYGFGMFSHKCVERPTPCAKLISVPKGIDKRRAICPEPAEYQFNQQGIWNILDNFLVHHPVLSRHISIHDQTVNREAALTASRYQDAATIDLSSASDSVSWALIKRVFRRVPALLGMLWCTRSTEVQLGSGRIIHTNKYAPMGSALCFPIESILFAAMCQVAENRTGHVRTRDTYHVYGDDIIVPTPLYKEICSVLTLTGFLVNEQKTFDPYARFKESCGIEAFDGIDVTPLGVSRKFSGISLSANRPELVSCYITFANALQQKGYRLARAYVLDAFSSLPQKFRPAFSWSDRRGISTVNPTNWRANRRYNSDLQCDEIQVGCFASTKDLDTFRDTWTAFKRSYGAFSLDMKYFEQLRRYSETKRQGLNDPDDLIQVILSQSRLHLVSRWIPEWVFLDPIGCPSLDFLQEHLFLTLEREWD